MYTQVSLLLGRLYRYKPDIGSTLGFADGLDIIVVILVAFTVWFAELDRDNTDGMVKGLKFPSPVVGTATGFETDQTERTFGNEWQ